MSSQSTNIDPAVVSFTTPASAGAYSGGSYSIIYAGNGYSIGNSFIIQGTVLGGKTPLNDLTATVTALTTGYASPGSSSGILTLSILGTSAAASAITFQTTLEYDFGPSFERDAADRTRAIRERLIYTEKRANSPITANKGGSLVPGGHPQTTPAGVNHLPAGNAELLWQQQGNQFRLSYLFGKLKCGGAFGGVFNLNGPNSFSAPGVQSGS